MGKWRGVCPFLNFRIFNCFIRYKMTLMLDVCWKMQLILQLNVISEMWTMKKMYILEWVECVDGLYSCWPVGRKYQRVPKRFLKVCSPYCPSVFLEVLSPPLDPLWVHLGHVDKHWCEAVCRPQRRSVKEVRSWRVRESASEEHFYRKDEFLV